MKKNNPETRFCNPFLVTLMIFAFMYIGALPGALVAVATAFAFHVDEAHLPILLAYLPFIAITGFVVLYTRFTRKDILRAYWGHSPSRACRHTLLGLAAGFGMNTLSLIPALLHGDVKLAAGSISPIWVIVSFLVVYIQSSAEEILFRGYGYMHLEKKYNPLVATIITAILFMVMHLSNDGIGLISILDLLAIAVFFAMAVQQLGDLWFVMAAHTAWNFTQNFIWGLPNSGLPASFSIFRADAARDSLLYDAKFGLEGSVTSVIVVAAGCLILYVLVHRQQKAVDSSVKTDRI